MNYIDQDRHVTGMQIHHGWITRSQINVPIIIRFVIYPIVISHDNYVPTLLIVNRLIDKRVVSNQIYVNSFKKP